jgi:lysophospholipase L1-like esterase
LLLILVIGGAAVVTEKILAWKTHNLVHPTGIKRYIKLREFNPLYSDILVPSDDALKMSDSLEQKEYVLRVDRQGFIMPSKVHEHPDLTLAFLGGSTTECTYVEEDNRFPYLTGRLIEKETGFKVNSYNAAKSGNNTLHSLDILLNKVIEVKPDMVIMMHNINDLAILIYEKTYWNHNPSRGVIIEKKPNLKTAMKNLEETVHLVRDMTFPNLYRELSRLLPFGSRQHADEFQAVRGQKITFDREALAKEFSLNLQTFINICQARSITPVLMTQPSRLKDHPDPLIQSMMAKLQANESITYDDFKGAFDLFNETIREVGAKNQVLVIDLAREIPPERQYICDVAHFNDEGSQLVAHQIAAKLVPAASISMYRFNEKGKIRYQNKEDISPPP